MKSNQIFNVGVFLDGRPGHEKQTMGIINSLQKKIRTNIKCIAIQKRTFFQQMLDWGRYFLFDPIQSEKDLCDYKLMIGTGTHTHLPMLLKKKKTGVPVVTCMTPSSILTKDFDILFVPHHDNTTIKENVFVTTGSPNCCENLGMHDSDRVLILIGGTDSKSHRWNSKDIVEQITKIIQFDPLKKYSISSSPRTPQQTAGMVMELAEKYSNVDFFHFNDTQPGWVETQYNSCKFVWVTGDSISMVYEALSSGCKVGVIPVSWKNRNSKFSRSESFLIKSGLVSSLEAYLNKEVCWKNEKLLVEAERCADEIIRRWV